MQNTDPSPHERSHEVKAPPPARPIDRVRAWLLDKHREQLTIDDDFDLIASRLIDSLQFVELVLFLEQLSGRPIDMESLSVDDFRSLLTIEARFLGAAQ
jgi:acyl carrier protein